MFLFQLKFRDILAGNELKKQLFRPEGEGGS